MALLSVDSTLTQNSTKLVRIFVLLLSTGLFTTLVMVKRADLLPHSCEIVFTSLLGFWTTVKCLLSSPLWIGIFIHLMVFLIAASSAFPRRETDDDVVASGDPHVGEIAESLVASPLPPAPPPSDENHQQLVLYRDEKIETEDPILLQMLEAREIEKTIESIGSDSLHHTGELLVKEDHPPLPNEWKDVSVENEGNDTMDATWKTITGGGKGRPKKKSLKKSETWRHRPAVQRVDSEELLPPTSPRWKELRKAETFNDAVSMNRRGGLRRDPSMSLEEFNMQVEAFIKKSKKMFLDTINRGF